MKNNQSYQLTPVGYIESCYKEKFGIPRQPGLVLSPATIKIDSFYANDEAFRELENFSHIWVIFIFHKAISEEWKPTVRPPRLGGNKRIGVFASRSMFRPNPVGLSVVELKSIERKDNTIVLNIVGGDFLDATPVIDIKPYLPYADAIVNAKAGYAATKPEVRFNVVFSNEAITQIKQYEVIYPQLKLLITDILQLDPRPAYQDKQQKNDYSMKLYDFDLKWKIENDEVVVTALELLSNSIDKN